MNSPFLTQADIFVLVVIPAVLGVMMLGTYLRRRTADRPTPVRTRDQSDTRA